MIDMHNEEYARAVAAARAGVDEDEALYRREVAAAEAEKDKALWSHQSNVNAKQAVVDKINADIMRINSEVELGNLTIQEGQMLIDQAAENANASVNEIAGWAAWAPDQDPWFAENDIQFGNEDQTTAPWETIYQVLRGYYSGVTSPDAKKHFLQRLKYAYYMSMNLPASTAAKLAVMPGENVASERNIEDMFDSDEYADWDWDWSDYEGNAITWDIVA
jgi:proteasome lid subunit RPN8/RPN11